MRNKILLTVAAALGAAALPSLAQAAPVACMDKPPYKNCVKDEVLFLDGADVVDGVPLANCGEDPTKNNCPLKYDSVVKRVLELVTEWGVTDVNQWDQFVIFGQQLAAASSPPGPLFYRDGQNDMTMTEGTNDVANIGLGVKPRQPGRPFVGYIAMGGTQQVPLTSGKPTPGTGTYGACGRAPRTPLDVPPAQPIPALCFPSFYSYFDAMAQATGALYGPYLKGADPKTSLSWAPLSKTGVVTAMGVTQPAVAGVIPRVWNAFLNTRGSIFGGNTYRDNGNGTFETTRPTPYFGINVPYAAGWKAGTVISGTQLLRFQPLDLYTMGFLPAQDVGNIQGFTGLKEDQVYRPVVKSWNSSVGPGMGLRQGVAVRPGDGKPEEIPWTNILMWQGGERQPPFAQARKYIKQLWVVVTKPQELIEAAVPAGDKMDPKKVADYVKGIDGHLDWVMTWRHQFPAYFYMLTQYRGRVVTTWDGVEDNAYWEFGQPTEDQISFEPAGGAVAAFNEPWVVPNSSEIRNAVKLTTVPGGGGAGLRYTGKPIAMKVPGSKSLAAPYNAVTVRMRIPPGGGVGKKAVATLAFDNGPTYRIPTNCGNPPKAGCVQETFLIPDGKFRTYSATLDSDPAFAMGTYTGFTFSPTSDNYEGEGIEVDYIRIANVPSPKDADFVAVPCSECVKNLNAAECNAAVPPAKDKLALNCGAKQPHEKVRVPRPDGWIDAEDNCPGTYNPLQEDGNEDGVGDACEDFDGDSVENAADNCPTTTNSRQRDSNGDGVGDVCDPSTETKSCFLQPESLGGRMVAAPGALFVTLFGVVFGALAIRRRNRRR